MFSSMTWLYFFLALIALSGQEGTASLLKILPLRTMNPSAVCMARALAPRFLMKNVVCASSIEPVIPSADSVVTRGSKTLWPSTPIMIFTYSINSSSSLSFSSVTFPCVGSFPFFTMYLCALLAIAQKRFSK